MTILSLEHCTSTECMCGVWLTIDGSSSFAELSSGFENELLMVEVTVVNSSTMAPVYEAKLLSLLTKSVLFSGVLPSGKENENWESEVLGILVGEAEVTVVGYWFWL